MILRRVVAHNERAGLFRAGPFMDTAAREVGARIRNKNYCTEFAKPPRVISARTVSPIFFLLMCFVPCPTCSLI